VRHRKADGAQLAQLLVVQAQALGDTTLGADVRVGVTHAGFVRRLFLVAGILATVLLGRRDVQIRFDESWVERAPLQVPDARVRWRLDVADPDHDAVAHDDGRAVQDLVRPDHDATSHERVNARRAIFDRASRKRHAPQKERRQRTCLQVTNTIHGGSSVLEGPKAALEAHGTVRERSRATL
jgi:hypothetical protein